MRKIIEKSFTYDPIERPAAGELQSGANSVSTIAAAFSGWCRCRWRGRDAVCFRASAFVSRANRRRDVDEIARQHQDQGLRPDIKRA